MSNNSDHVCISDCSPPISVAGSASPESLSSAFAAEKALAELREYVERGISEARDRMRVYVQKSYTVQFHYTDGQWDALVGVRNRIDRILTEGLSAANGALTDVGRAQPNE